MKSPIHELPLDTLYLYSLIPVLSIALLLCFTLALRGAKDRRLHGLTALFGSIALWVLALTACFIDEWVWWGQRFAASGTLVAASYHHAVWDLTEQPKRWLVWVSYAIAFGILGFGVFEPGVLYDPVSLSAGPYFWHSMTLAITAATIPAGQLFLAGKKATGQQRRLLVMLAAAGACCFLGAWSNALLLSSGHKLPFGIFLVLLSMFLFGQIVSQVQSKVARKLIDRSLLYSALAALISSGFLFGTLGILGDAQSKRTYGLSAFFLLVMAAVAIEPLRQHVVERMGGKLLRQRASGEELAKALVTQQEKKAHDARLVELGTFISAIAHEVRNPLGVMGANLRLMEMEGGTDEELIEEMRAQIERAEHFVSDLLDYGRPRPLELRILEASTIVELAVSSAQSGRHEQNRAIEWRIDLPKEDPLIEADQSQLMQVFIAVCDNAVLAAIRSKEPIIAVQMRPRKDDVIVVIEDSGAGVPKEVLPRLFEPFVTSRPREEGGTGLGLAIASRLVQRHQGTIQVNESEALGGARFEIILPRVQHLVGKEVQDDT